MIEKTHLRTTFDQYASLFEKARPGYPNALFEDIIEFSKISCDGRILEIGCGTGQATLPFAERGYSIHCIELGANLAAVAKQNLSNYPKVCVTVGDFETYPLDETRRFLGPAKERDQFSPWLADPNLPLLSHGSDLDEKVVPFTQPARLSAENNIILISNKE